jgi:hypothetical protein
VQTWSNTVGGAKAIAVHEQWIGLYGGYGDDRDRLVVGRLGGEELEVVGEHRLTLPDGGSVDGASVIGRGSALHLISGREWYRLDLAELSQL